MKPEEYCLVDDLIEFTDKSLQWCRQSSEAAAKKVACAVEYMVEDSIRIERMTRDSIDLVKVVKDRIAQLFDTKASVIVSTMIKTLEELGTGNREIDNLINPIIEALQFQDRLSQNLDNQLRMLRVWIEYRENVRSLGVFDESMRHEFGRLLAEKTTMVDERDIIRAEIPGLDLAEEAQSVDVGLF